MSAERPVGVGMKLAGRRHLRTLSTSAFDTFAGLPEEALASDGLMVLDGLSEAASGVSVTGFWGEDFSGVNSLRGVTV